MATLSWIVRVGTKWYHKYPYQSEAKRDSIQSAEKKKCTQRRKQCEGRERDWTDMATSQVMPAATRS